MNIATLDILRCPYCGGRLDLVTSLAREQGEPAIAARLEGVRLVRR